MVIVTSKFLEWSIDLLREEDKLFELKPPENKEENVLVENDQEDKK